MSRFPSHFLDEVRDRVRLSEIVGRTVIWDKRKSIPAKGDFWACCPFHNEKTPSFHVEDRKGRYHCFGCHATGDVFRWLTDRQGMDFPAAVAEAASAAGIPLPRETPEERERARKKLSLIEVNQKAADWFRAQLRSSQQAMAYAASRGLTGADLDAFGIGYAPDGSSLLRAAIVPVEGLLEAGLAGRSEDGRPFDWFRGRLMFPILDARGRPTGFSGRSLGAGEPKYLNTPTTPIFDKGAILYNGARAKQEAWNGAVLAVVEGHIDVIASERIGIATVAPMGTALTETHVAQIIRMHESPVFCFDGDAAGQRAMAKAMDMVLPHASPAFQARFAVLPSGEDPDSMIRRNPDAYRRIIEGAKPLAQALWDREVTAPVVTPEQRAGLEGRLREALTRIADKDTRKAYGHDFKDRLGALGKRPKVYRSNSYSQHSTSPAAMRLIAGAPSVGAGLNLRESIIFGAVASAPLAAIDEAENLVGDERLSPQAVDLISRLVGELAQSPGASIADVLEAANLSDAAAEAIAKAQAAGVTLSIGSEAPAAVAVIAGMRRH